MIQKILLAIIRGGSGKILLIILGIIIAIFVYRKLSTNNETTISHDVLVEKIEAMGKMELTKFTIKDIIEKNIIKNWWPDSKVLFVAVGEAAGCIDLSKVTKNDVKRSGDSILITLPKPEICYVKINHEKSKVYDISGVHFKEETKKLVEEIYLIAEKELTKEAQSMGILEETKKNANLILKPLFENLTNKKVGFKFKQRY